MKKKPSRATGRASVPIPERVRAAAGYPELVGLEEGASTAAIYERLIGYGYDAAIRARRQQQQLAAAIAYERDPERQEIAADLQRSALNKDVL